MSNPMTISNEIKSLMDCSVNAKDKNSTLFIQTAASAQRDHHAAAAVVIPRIVRI